MKSKTKVIRDFENLLKYFGSVCLICGVFLVVFAFAEIGYRKFRKSDLTYQFNNDGHFARPYVMSAGKPFTNWAGGQHNILGYRDRMPSITKEPGEYRIFILGGSTVHLYNISESLEDYLHQSGKKHIKVFNFGATSSISRQDAIRIMLDIAGYAPDLIVHYGGGNDFGFGIDPRINYPHRFIFYEQSVFFTQTPENYDWVIAFAMSSQILRDIFSYVLLKRLASKIDIRTPPPEQILSLKVQAYLQNLRWAMILSGQVGAHFLAIYQPQLAYKDILSESEKTKVSPALVESANRFRKLAFEETSRNNYGYLLEDCSHVFDGFSGNAFDDLIHVTRTREAQDRTTSCINSKVKAFLGKHPHSDLKKPQLPFIPEETFILGKPSASFF